MDTEFVRILSRNVGQDRPVVNFSKAIESEAKDAFLLSGSEHIMCFLRQKLGDDVPFLIDFSAIPSSFKNDGKLADFISIYDPNSSFVDNSNLDSAFAFVYGYLQKNSLGMFYHPRFFDSPDKPNFYYSNNSGVFPPKNNYQFNTGYEWYEERLGTSKRIYFKNMSFQISYESYKEKSEKALQKTESLQRRNDILLERYNNFFLRFRLLNRERNTHLLSVPIIGYPSKENETSPFEGLGSIFVYFIKDNFDEDEIKGLANDLWFLGLQITYNSIFQIAMELAEKARKESVKSAKAAIMSRNMSHNLGSHVMSYLKQHLGSVKDMVNDRILADIIKSESDLTKKLNCSIENTELPFLVGMGHFVSYLQERQDFIATIATDFIPYYSTVNFKDGIYDTLNPDKKYERHSNKETVLQTNNILLGNIARSEGLGRPTSPTQNDQSGSTLSDIVLKFKDFNGNALEGKFLKDEDKPYLKAMRDSLEEMRLCDVSLPGGIVGRQAIFSIVENVIRNAAKHGLWRKVGHLEVTFNVFKKENLDKEELKCYLDDKFSPQHLSLREVFERFYCDATDANDLYFITLTDNLDFKEGSLKHLRKAIAERYVNERGELEGANKGIKEMRISASWLRSVTDESCIIPENFDPASDVNWTPKKDVIAPILYARISKDRENDNIGHLQYIFCLARPKKVAILSSAYEAEKLTSEGKHKLISNSWGIFSPEDFKSESNKSYEFIILLDEDKESYKEIRRKTSSRLFLLSEVRKKIEQFPVESTLLDVIYSGIYEPDYEPDKLMLQLYKFLAEYDNEQMAIVDDRAWGNNKKGSNASKIDIGIVSVYMTQDNSIQFPYVYRNHYELSKNFNTVINELETTYKGNCFIEGISGSNSTDRLVRNEIIDEKWGYKHLHVMKEKIAIFDERIFSKVYGIEETDFEVGSSSVKVIVERQRLFVMEQLRKRAVENPHQETLCSIPVSLAVLFRRVEDSTQNVDDLEKNFASIAKILSAHEDTKFIELKSVAELKEEQQHPIAKNYTGTAYVQKGVSVFTIIKNVSASLSETSKDKNTEKGSSVFYLCGLQNQGDTMSTLYREMTNEVDNETNKVIITSKSICKRLAEISWSDSPNEPLVIQPIDGTPDEVIKGMFDSFSIHQGLLDKLYEGFGIKSCPEKKELLTKNFYDYFKKKSKESDSKSFAFREKNDTFDHWFLPGLTIHSGRSKPSSNDMPQQVPFIQYASIEHAVFDCKYSLVELLDYARYE